MALGLFPCPISKVLRVPFIPCQFFSSMSLPMKSSLPGGPAPHPNHLCLVYSSLLILWNLIEGYLLLVALPVAPSLSQMSSLCGPHCSYQAFATPFYLLSYLCPTLEGELLEVTVSVSFPCISRPKQAVHMDMFMEYMNAFRELTTEFAIQCWDFSGDVRERRYNKMIVLRRET